MKEDPQPANGDPARDETSSVRDEWLAEHGVPTVEGTLELPRFPAASPRPGSRVVYKPRSRGRVGLYGRFTAGDLTVWIQIGKRLPERRGYDATILGVSSQNASDPLVAIREAFARERGELRSLSLPNRFPAEVPVRMFELEQPAPLEEDRS